MCGFGEVDPGAARPPWLFGLALAIGVGLLGPAAGARAEAADASCRYVGYGPLQVEGFDGPDPFGVQLIIRDGRWVLRPSRIGVAAFCPSCSPSDISKGVLAIGRSPFLAPVPEGDLRGETGQESASRLEFALHPRAIAMALWRITSLLPGKVEPLSDLAPITLWDVSGLARVVEVGTVTGVAPGVAVALEDRCFSMFAVFFRKDEGEVSVGDILKTSGSLGVLKYQPERHKLSPAIQFPLGDARKKWEEDQK